MHTLQELCVMFSLVITDFTFSEWSIILTDIVIHNPWMRWTVAWKCRTLVKSEFACALNSSEGDLPKVWGLICLDAKESSCNAAAWKQREAVEAEGEQEDSSVPATSQNISKKWVGALHGSWTSCLQPVSSSSSSWHKAALGSVLEASQICTRLGFKNWAARRAVRTLVTLWCHNRALSVIWTMPSCQIVFSLSVYVKSATFLYWITQRKVSQSQERFI